MYQQKDGLLRISDIAEKANVLPSTIRHYTDLGLLQHVATTEGGHRLYHESETLLQLARIKRLASHGMSLPEIKASLSGNGIKKVLVVDDEPEVGEFVEDLLKDRFKMEVKIARDGFTAGRVLAEYVPDLVVLDLMLPGIDGFEVCKQIRADANLMGVKILAVTGYDTSENAQRIMSAGADMMLSKPLETHDVLKAVQQLLNLETLPAKPISQS
ncbi:MAG TPA: response regulator [Elusimicrobiota bacterium]|nr:response regulator [Elusimicrobiota bacterium]